MTASASSIPAGEGAGGPVHRCRQLIDVHFSGRLPPAGEREMRGHLVTCGVCRAYYERHLLLAKVDPEGARPMRDRLARGLGLPPARSEPAMRTARRWRVLTGASAIAAVCAVILVVAPRRPPDPEPRGAVPRSQLLVYELAHGEKPRPVVSQIRPDTGLAFAYANIGRKRRLMVFAVDERRRVYWYHPAWQSPAENPIAIEIAGDDAVHEIPQAITHHFAGRHLQLFGVFFDRAMSARDMEDLVIHAPADEHQRLQLRVAGADVTRLDLDLMIPWQ
jgi:hypothetical protein